MRAIVAAACYDLHRHQTSGSRPNLMAGVSRINGPLALLIGGVVATAVLLIQEHVSLRVSGPGAGLFAFGCLACLSVRCGLREGLGRGRRVTRDLAEYVGLFGASAMIGAIASYPDAAASSGSVDPLLEHADRLMRFDWVGLYLLVARHPFLQAVEAAAYQCIYVVPAILLFWFAWCGQKSEAHRFLLSFSLSAAMTLLLFRWLPAAGPLARLWIGPVPYLPQSALYQARIIPALQQHRLHTVDIDALHGLVSAPSFHAASGTLYILFARRMPGVRTALISLSLLMLAATPVEGTHYLVDIIAGMLVALAAYTATALWPIRSMWGSPSARWSAGSASPERDRQRAQ